MYLPRGYGLAMMSAITLLCRQHVSLATRATALLLAGVAALGCRDEAPRVVVSVEIAGFTPTLVVGEDVDIEATCLDADGRPIRDVPVHWTSSLPQIATVLPRGRTATVRAVHPGPVKIAVACRKAPVTFWELEWTFGSQWFGGQLAWVTFLVQAEESAAWAIDGPSEIAMRAPSESDSVSGVTRLMVARGTSSTGDIVGPEQFTWSSSDSAVVSITSGGLARARAPGVAALRATRLAQVESVTVTVASDDVSAPWDVALVDAHWTQGPQDSAQRIPILRGGRAAVVNVLAFATSDAPEVQVVLSATNASGAEVHRDTVPLRPSLTEPTFAAPSAQFLIPRPVVNVASHWRLFVLPEVADVDGSNDSLPRAGVATLLTASPPVLKLHLVPIRLAKHGNAMTSITGIQTEWYDSVPRLRLPLGAIETTVGAPLTVHADFFAEDEAPTAGDTPFFHAVLEAVDAARVKSPALADRYWVGVLPKPAGATTSRWGGMAYFPQHGADIGPMSRSQVTLGHDWYPTAPTVPGQIVLHELGHNFGRRHAPCGSPGGPDPYFPNAGGRIGKWVTWTTVFASGGQDSAQVMPDTLFDYMSYCGPKWVSAYTYLGIIRFRELELAALHAPEPIVPIAVVRGTFAGGQLRLSAVELGEGRPVSAPVGGPVVVELLDAADQVLLRATARLGQVSEGDGLSFVAHLAIDGATSARVRTARVRASGAEVRRAF